MNLISLFVLIVVASIIKKYVKKNKEEEKHSATSKTICLASLSNF